MTSRWIQAGLLVLFLCACSGGSEERVAPSGPETIGQQTSVKLIEGSQVTAEIHPLEDGQWRVDYVFETPQTVLAFPRSTGDYRRRTWRAEAGTPDIERIEGADAIVFDKPSLTASFEVTPYARRLPRDYTPFLKFSNGEGAIFLQQFEVDAFERREDLVEASSDRDVEGLALRFGARVISEKSLLMNGVEHQGQVEYIAEVGDQEYIYIGNLPLEQGESYIGVIDPELPAHIRESFDDDLARIFAALEERWGFALAKKSTVYFAFGGTRFEGLSTSGSVAGGDTLVLRASGKELLEPDETVRRRILWFFAHEAAHLFEGGRGMAVGSNSQAWWHEGSADAMAHDLLSHLGVDSEAYLLKAYRQRIDECGVELERQPLIGAWGQVPYICGDLVAIIADSALVDHNLYDIWNTFIDLAPADLKNADIDDFFLTTLSDMGGSTDTVEALRSLIQDRQENGRIAILKAFEAAGLEYELDSYGALTSLQLP